ncbi:MAG: hypothetical protein HWN80_01520 [Candidatus Lokiarchaeota archaeon]|nr:hypothetical protein [Candidatus Lokiarchaeota archaeon]
MEKEVLEKIESQIALESDMIPIKGESTHGNESNFWKYLDYSNWIPGEIEVEEEITKDYDWWERKSIKK